MPSLPPSSEYESDGWIVGEDVPLEVFPEVGAIDVANILPPPPRRRLRKRNHDIVEFDGSECQSATTPEHATAQDQKPRGPIGDSDSEDKPIRPPKRRRHITPLSDSE